ncbi:hypothetical protein ED733_001342 [Metarhizium rileyi]|uniref:Uncharacterized protein n=1 Tax=Metarhizium rileyi (strain RCEF 4871) TaxID=1649241 RepID=A0A5C6G6D6_METRR|nr:hypothetical protein ED733_001342 [Metarhizium rileyi]
MANPSNHAAALSASIEVEFLVAVERDGHDYTTAASSCETDVGSSQTHRWVCPSQADDPSSEILQQCKAVLSQATDNVIIRHNEAHLTERSRQSARFDSWVLQPCPTSRASSGSPKDYDWRGIKLRSPLIHETELTADNDPLNCRVETLRKAILIHTNPTCSLSIVLRPCDALTLVRAKKLATMVWLTERDLLTPLRHLNTEAVICPQPITTASLTATSSHREQDTSEPLDPLLEGIMHAHIPTKLRDIFTLCCLRRIWSCPSLVHLSSALRDQQQRALAFSLYVYDDDDAQDSTTSYWAAACFRCAEWHPRNGLDMSRCWTDVILALGKAMTQTPERFKRLVADMDDVNSSTHVDGADAGRCHGRRLLQTLAVDEARCAEWEGIMAA